MENLWLRTALRMIVGMAAMLTMASCLNDNELDGAASVLSVGDALPSFTIEVTYPDDDWSSAVVSIEDLRGKPSLIIFFNTSCPDCQAELPVIQELYTAIVAAQGEDASTIIAISRAEDYDSVEAYWTDNGLTIPFSAQDDTKVYSLFANHTIPHIFLSSPSLVVQQIWTDDPMPTFVQLYSYLL